MVKIDSIKIKGYKNIKSADLRLHNFNVIIGANNSGKSNFIQSISFLNYIINSSLDEVEKSFANGFRTTNFAEVVPSIFGTKLGPLNKIENLDKEGTIEFELTFSNLDSNRNFTYLIDIDWSFIRLKTTCRIKNERLDVKESKRPGPATSIFNRSQDTVKYGSEFSKMDVLEKVPSHFSILRLFKIFTELQDDYKDAITSLNEILKTPIFYFSHIELLKTDKERRNLFNGRVVSFELEQEIAALEEGEKWDIFKDAIRNILNIEDASITKIGGSPDEKIPLTKFLLFTHHGLFKSLNQLSDGTLLIIALVTKILCTRNSLFLIEEPENSTHPKALTDLMSFIKSFSENSQFIITSHSIAILNKTRIEDIIASTIDSDGFSELYNITSRKDLKNKLKKSSTNFSDELFFSIDNDNEFD